MRKIIIMIAACIASAVTYASTATLVFAGGHNVVGTVVEGSINTDTIWTKEGSPYLIRNHIYLGGMNLTIMPGAEVRADEGYISQINMSNGRLAIMGSPDERVTIDIPMYLSGVKGEINNLYLSDTLTIYNSELNIRGLNLTNLLIGWQSKLNIENSLFADSTKSVMLLEDRYLGSEYVFSSSTFGGNAALAIWNMTNNSVMAKNNWWGSVEGPNSATGKSTEGLVEYRPWLDHDPLLASSTAPLCCSDVLFIPGLQASRLHASKNQLWEPNRNADVSKLYLDSSGNSLDKTIYSGDPIGNALGLVGIYDGFMSSLDFMKQEGTISNWKSFGYDWRKPVREVVEGMEKKATTSVSLMEVVKEMASSSKTGKVTLIAHSNGGLVAKYLVKKLQESGQEKIIDTVISVAVPYLGTPEAIRGLLHGGGQSILKGLIASEATMRGLGKNMPSAYSLLPSMKYFENVFGPTIAFASTTVAGLNDGSYPLEINDYKWQMDFIKDSFKNRSVPSFSDTVSPEVGNPLIADSATDLHREIDGWAWPLGIKRFALVGTNLITTKGIKYGSRIVCSLGILGPTCSKKLSYDTKKTLGDGTVVVPSAMSDAGELYEIDLAKEKEISGDGYKHADILESPSVQTAIKNIIKGKEVVQDENSSVSKGVQNENVGSLVLSTHSPVELHIFDAEGRHTGRRSLPKELNVNDSLYVGAYEENVPGSSYEEIATDEGTETYISVNENSGNVMVQILGTGIGYATFEIEKTYTDEKANYSMIPVNPLSVSVVDIDWEKIISNPIKDAIPSIQSDTDGDGISDHTIYADSGEMPTQTETIEDWKKVAIAVAGEDPSLKHFVERLEHIEELAKNGKLKQAQGQGKSIMLNIGHIKTKTMDDSVRKEMISVIESVIKQVEAAQN